MSLDNSDWHMWRSTPEFSQRVEAVIAPDGQTTTGAWKKSTDRGVTWEHDFNVDYLRNPPTHAGSGDARANTDG